MAFCPVCGWAMESGVSFCPKCGTPYAAHAPPGAPAPGPAPAPGSVKLDFGDLLRHGFERATKDLGAFLPTVGLVVVVSWALSLGANLWLLGQAPQLEAIMGEAATAADVEAFFAQLGSYLAKALSIGLVAGLVSLVATGLAFVVADRIDRGEKPTLGEAWGALMPRFGNFLGTYVLIGLAVIGCIAAGFALFFLVVPIFLGIAVGIYLAIRWMLAPVHSVLATGAVTQNLKESTRLTKGNRGVLFGAVFVLALAAAIPAGIVGAIIGVVGAVSGDAGMSTSPVAIAIQSVVALPFQLFVAFAMPAALVRAYRQLTSPPAPPPAYAPPPPGPPTQG